MSDEMTNDELRRRLVKGMPLCDKEHEAHSEELSTRETRYWLTCGDELLNSVIIGTTDAYGPEPFFERWNYQHNLDVTRKHLERLLDPPPEPQRQVKPLDEVADILEGFAQTVATATGLLNDRITALEAAVEALDQRTMGSRRIGGTGL